MEKSTSFSCSLNLDSKAPLGFGFNVE